MTDKQAARAAGDKRRNYLRKTIMQCTKLVVDGTECAEEVKGALAFLYPELAKAVTGQGGRSKLCMDVANSFDEPFDAMELIKKLLEAGQNIVSSIEFRGFIIKHDAAFYELHDSGPTGGWCSPAVYAKLSEDDKAKYKLVVKQQG